MSEKKTNLEITFKTNDPEIAMQICRLLKNREGTVPATEQSSATAAMESSIAARDGTGYKSKQAIIGNGTSELPAKTQIDSKENPSIPDLRDYVGDDPIEGTTLAKHDSLKEFFLDYDDLVANNLSLKNESERYDKMKGDTKRDNSHDYKKTKERNEWERFYELYDTVKKQHKTWSDEQITEQVIALSIALSTKSFTYTRKYHKVIIRYR